MRWVAIALLASVPARADTLVEALTRHDEHDISALRAKLPDPSARCALGVAYIFRDDLTRAALYLESCTAARIAPGVAGWARLAVRALEDRLRMSELAEVEVTTTPAGLAVTIDTVPGEVFPTPSTIWLPDGTHELHAGEASTVVTVHARERAAAHLVLDLEAHARVDPNVAVMRANDCMRWRRRQGSNACQLSWLDDDLDLRTPTRWRGLPDPVELILQTAEGL